ncbi:hypothetical protein FKM82_021847 [Ascaphus truei]
MPILLLLFIRKNADIFHSALQWGTEFCVLHKLLHTHVRTGGSRRIQRGNEGPASSQSNSNVCMYSIALYSAHCVLSVLQKRQYSTGNYTVIQ